MSSFFKKFKGKNFFFFKLSPLLSLSLYLDMKLDCKGGFVTLVWTDGRSQMDTSLLRLGSCFPTSLTDREAVFTVDFNDCNFRRLVSSPELRA